MKKLLLVLMVVALAAFLFTGCMVVPDDDEPVDDGVVVTEVTVEIEDSVVVAGKTYVSCGSHTITVTFPAPVVGGVLAYITDCTGDYTKTIIGGGLVLFTDAERKVWTGSGDFGKVGFDCCASYVVVEAGECEPEACIWFPVIVDCDLPFALIEVSADDCTCDDCELTFESTTIEDVCDPDEECCGDDCSGLYSWSITIYDEDPFDICCAVPCATPVDSSSGTCPIDWTTKCLVPGDYWAVVNLVDNVGNEVEYYAEIVIADDWPDCSITVTDYCADLAEGGEFGCDCTSWDESAMIDTDDYIGYCEPDDNCCGE